MFEHVFSDLLDGASVPLRSFNRPVPARDADEFAHHLKPLSLGYAEAQWVGSLLLQLSAESGEWKAVPWRKLRNAFMGYGLLQRLRDRSEARIPALPKDAPIDVFVPGKPLPIGTLLLGLKHLLDCKLAERCSIEDEDYLVPTTLLVGNVPIGDDPVNWV